MIDPEHAIHFDGDDGIDCATRVIVARFPDGTENEIVLRVGRPFAKGNDSSNRAVRVELEGLEQIQRPMMGIDGFQAIACGVALLVSRLEDYVEKGLCEFYWPGTVDKFNPADLLLKRFDQQD